MKFGKWTVIALTLFASHAGAAEQLDALRLDVEKAKQRLASQRDEELQQRGDVGSVLLDLEKELMVKRRLQRLARMETQDRKLVLEKQQRIAKGFEKDADYIGSILRGYALELDLALAPGQKESMGTGFSEPSQVDTNIEEKADVINAAIDRLESVLGGEIRSARAINDQGAVMSGKVCNYGPAMWFISDDKKQAGALIIENGAEFGRVIVGDNDEVQSLIETGSAKLPVDITGGKARAIDLVQADPLSIFKKGGVWLWPILSIALISAICGVMKMLQLAKIKTPSGLWVADILQAVKAGNLEEAERVSKSETHPAGAMIGRAIGYVDAGVDVVEEVIYEQLIGVQSNLQKWLPFIAVTAATAPLLGLLGTVSGMIRMFNVITVTGTGDVKPMAGGISEALVTTLFGLVVAIPALVLHAMLSRRSNGVVQNTEKLGLTFVNGLRKM